MYYFVKFFAWISFYFYFSRIEINGRENIPKVKTPTLFAPNHQAAFLDPMLIGVYTKHPVHFLTRSDVFNPVSNFFFKRLNMIPIYRMRDGLENLSKNQNIFTKCIKILRAKRSLLIFPEGNQAGDYYLRPLTKGFYRISKGAVDNGVSEIHIIPVGINYFNHDHSGHKLILNFGKPIVMSNRDKSTVDYREIRRSLSESIKELMLIPDYTDDYPQRVKSISRNTEELSFSDLRESLKQRMYVKPPKKHPILLTIRKAFTLPNGPIHLMSYYVLRYKMTDPLFESSLKIGLLTLVLPFWLLFSFFIGLMIWGSGVAVSLIIFQVSCLFAYSLCGRYSRE